MDRVKAGGRVTRTIGQDLSRIFLITVFCLSVFCLLIAWMLRQTVITRAEEYSEITAERLSNQLDTFYDKIDVFAMTIATDSSVQKFLMADRGSQMEYLRDVQEMRAYYMDMETAIRDIAFVSTTVHYSGIFRPGELEELQKMKENRQFRLVSVRSSSFASYSEETPVLVYARDVMSQGRRVGTILISLDTDYFNVQQDKDQYSYYLLATESGPVYGFNCGEEIQTAIFRAWRDRSQNKDQGQYLVHERYSNKMLCYLLYAVDTQKISSGIDGIQRMIWYCVFLAVVFATIVMMLVFRQVVYPLQKFRDVIRDIGSTPVKMFHPEQKLGGSAEIQEIGREFYRMLKEQDDLNRRVFEQATSLYEVKVQKQQAELSFLRSQIDPHFLYNTLELLRQKALEDHSPETAEMAVDLAKIFRYNTKGSDEVPLSEELEMIRSYIHIQTLRFRDRFQVFYAIDGAAEQCMVMKMILQPFVENAIIHGLEPKEGKGCLFLAARIEQGMLVLTVKDNGVGMPGTKLEEIQNALQAKTYDTSRHLGILNTQARLKLSCGGKAGVTIESSEGDGTTAVLRLPARTEETGEGDSV